MKKIIFIAAGLLMFVANVLAQDLTITVKVVDQNGKPFPGVVVSVPESKSKLITNAQGIVNLNSKKNSIIQLSFLEQFRKQIEITSEKMEVVLGEDSRVLGLGMGETITKLTSSMAVEGISFSDEIYGGTSERIMDNMYGILPGLQVYQKGSGAWPEGAVPYLEVRGAGSTTNGVIFIVDGVNRDPATIDFEEVQTISVLKDAAALAIYGLRGADGAVVITTKRGGAHKFQAKVKYNFGMEMPYGMPEMANPVEYAEALNEARLNDKLSPFYSQQNIQSLKDGSNTVIPTSDWRNLMLRDMGYDHNATVTLDGSVPKAQYYIYANFKSNRGFFNNTHLTENLSTQSEYTSLKLRTNLNVKVTPTTDFIVNLAGRIQQKQMPNGFSGLDAMYHTPTVGIPTKFNDKWVGTTEFENPLGKVLGSGNSITFQRMLSADFALRQDLSVITKGLSAEIRLSYDNSADITDNKSFKYTYYNIFPVYDAEGNLYDYNLKEFGNDTEIAFGSGLTHQYMQIDIWAKLMYERAFGRHNVRAMFMFNRDRYSLTGANNSRVNHDYIFNASYNYGGRYLADLVLTGSGSSYLPHGDKFRFLPAGSVAWVASEEPFLKDSKVLNLLKIRASYGVTGMDRNLDYDMDKQFNGDKNTFIFISPTISRGAGEGPLPSVGIMPEMDYKANVGIDLRLFRGLTAQLDVFHNTRKYIRNAASNKTSQVIGIGQNDIFTGEMVNKGVEASLGWTQTTGDFRYYIKGNFAFARNKITSVEEEYTPYDYMYLLGNSRDRFYGLVSDGYYQDYDFDSNGNLMKGNPICTFGKVQPGDIRYKDLNEDGYIDKYDYTFQKKSTHPEIYYGLRLGFDYKGFGLNAVFQGAANYTIVTDLPSIYQPLYGNNKNISKHYLANHWTPENPEGRYPRLTTKENNNNFRPSDLWTEEGGYFKLRELEVYYSFPKNLLSKAKMSEARIFVRGHNLFSVDNIGIMDPEYMSLGYPVARTISLGCNLAF